jgi:hypothetical protein
MVHKKLKRTEDKEKAAGPLWCTLPGAKEILERYTWLCPNIVKSYI